MPPPVADDSPEPSRLARLWADLAASTSGQAVLRYLSHALLLALIIVMLWAGKQDFTSAARLAEQVIAKAQIDFTAFTLPAANTTAQPLSVATAAAPPSAGVIVTDTALSRTADPYTLIPTRGRGSVITYTVQTGDTLFGIADKFNLKPETLLWGNYFVLKDDPHLLYPGQTLNILPVDGTYHYVTQGNTLDQIAKFYGVTPQAISDWGGNNLDPLKPVLAPDTWSCKRG
jgi:LysM repeat protein